MTRRLLAAIAASSSALLVACSGGGTSEPETVTVISTQAPVTTTERVEESPTERNDEGSPTPKDIEPEQETPTSETEDADPVAAPAPAPASNHSINYGQIGGNCGTSSLGHTIEAGSATPCEFAAAIYDAAMSATYTYSASRPDVTALPRTNITAFSPVTGQSYDLRCYITSDQRALSCDKPDDSTVSADFALGPNAIAGIGSSVHIIE